MLNTLQLPLHVDFYRRYYEVQRLTTPNAPSPKSLSFSFKHTATGVFRRDSLHKEVKCHNGVNCCLKLINLNHLTRSVDFGAKSFTLVQHILV